MCEANLMPETAPSMHLEDAARDPAPALDSTALREVLGCFATGVAVATTVGEDGRPVGLTINSFNSVSLDPPLVLWSIARSAPSFEAFRVHKAFTINILAEEQRELCRRFATPSDDKFADVAFESGYKGVPRLDGAIAYLECDTHDRFPGGDHTIIVGRVLNVASEDRAPLVYHRGQFMRFATAD